jgi:hypothetical protein
MQLRGTWNAEYLDGIRETLQFPAKTNVLTKNFGNPRMRISLPPALVPGRYD